MNRYLSALATLAFSFTIVSYDGITDLYARHKDGRLWPRLTEVYTNQQNKEFYGVSYDAAKFVIDNRYVPAYLCASKKDVSKCKPISKK